MDELKTFFTKGKILITGEYAVLDGAMALAVSSKKGQYLEVEKNDIHLEHCIIHWEAFDHKNKNWLKTSIEIPSDRMEQHSADSVNATFRKKEEQTLVEILHQANILNNDFLRYGEYFVKTKLEFPNDWGLGSSSTLLCNIAKWAEINAFELSKNTLGGSGVDIAVGMLGNHVLYQNPENWNGFVFNPPFKDKLFFVHLGKKQNSRAAIQYYKQFEQSKSLISAISDITFEVSKCRDFMEFQSLITEHERMIGLAIKQETVKSKYFNDFSGAIKSLGAWGGDFILACGEEADVKKYFADKKLNTVISFADMVD